LVRLGGVWLGVVLLGVVPLGVVLPTLPAQPPLGTGPSYTWDERFILWLTHIFY
jgi:hypothetical protein